MRTKDSFFVTDENQTQAVGYSLEVFLDGGTLQLKEDYRMSKTIKDINLKLQAQEKRTSKKKPKSKP